MRWGVALLLTTLLATLAGLPASAQAHSWQLSSEQHVIDLAPLLDITTSNDDVVSPEQLAAQPIQWEPNTGDTISFGYKRDTYWFQTHWRTPADLTTDWILEAANSQIDDLRVYLYENDHLIQQWQVGDRRPYAERPIDHPLFLFPVALEPNTDYRLLIRFRNTEATELPLRLMTRDVHTSQSHLSAWVDGIFNGFLIIMAAYSLALFAILRDKTYLYYVSYILSMLLFFMFQQGDLYALVFPQSPLIQHHVITFISLYIFFSIAFFFRELLDLPTTVPHHWRIYKILLVLHAVYCLLFWVLDYQVAMLLMVINTVLATVIAVVSIAKLAYEGSHSARIVVVGWTLLLFFLISFTAAKTGLIYNEFLASYGLRIGISVEILIFSFALSYRINQEREAKERALELVNQERSEKIQAQELALHREIETNQAKEEALLLEIQHREELEQLVEDRTADLERTLSELEKTNQELERLSCKDGLTGLFNRRSFDQRLEECWLQSQREQTALSLLIIDIDHFKQINDKRGHLCGDHVLRQFAELLNDILHRPSDFIARYGGEEFAILLMNTPQEGAEKIAERIVSRAASEPMTWQGEPFHISVSIGLDTGAGRRHESADTLVANADAALYQAKHQGRNRWITHSAAAVRSL